MVWVCQVGARVGFAVCEVGARVGFACVRWGQGWGLGV